MEISGGDEGEDTEENNYTLFEGWGCKNMSYENLANLVKYIRKIQINDDNNVNIGVTGRLGCGKSTLSMQISQCYVKKYLGEKSFNPEKYIAYNNDEVMEKIHSLPMYAPLIGDEAVRFAWSRDWNKSENKELARLSTQIRTKKLIFFMNIPKLSWIDSIYREGLLDMWMWVHASFDETGKKIGNVLMFEPDLNQGEWDSWHISLLTKKKKRKDRIGRFTDIEKIYHMVKSHPCFIDTFVFPKMNERIYSRYKELRDSRAFEKGEQFISQKDSSKIILYNIKDEWEEFKGVVANAKFKKPTFEILAKHLTKDPRTKNVILSHVTIKKWIDEVKQGLPLDEIRKKNEEKEKLDIEYKSKIDPSLKETMEKHEKELNKSSLET